jgi:hypothetical protein
MTLELRNSGGRGKPVMAAGGPEFSLAGLGAEFWPLGTAYGKHPRTYTSAGFLSDLGGTMRRTKKFEGRRVGQR